jgi:hypothetical protein
MASPSHREHDVRVLQDAAQSVRSLRKDVDAQWVAGLRPEDELAELRHAALRRREAAEAEKQEQQRARRRAISASRPMWLRWPIIFGVLWVLALWVRALDMWPGASLGNVLQGEYPPYEFHLWKVIRNAMTTSSPLVALVIPSVGVTTLASLFAATTAFQFGAATQDFLCFCGFGFSTLSLFSGLSTGAVFLAGCETVEAECFTPLVATWVSSLMRWVMPWLALWPIAALWDGLNVRRGAVSLLMRYRWRTLASLPLVGYTAVVAATKWVCYRTDMTVCGEPSAVSLSALLATLPGDPDAFRHYGLLQLGLEITEFVGAIVAALILSRLVLQKAIGLVPIQQADDADAHPALMPPPAPPAAGGKSKTE